MNRYCGRFRAQRVVRGQHRFRFGLLVALLAAFLVGSPTIPHPVGAADGAAYSTEPASIPGVAIPVIAVPGDGQQSYVAPPAALGQPRAQSATISVTYSGFTPEAQAAFQLAIDIWETQITSSVPIRVSAEWSALDDGVLGSAGPTTFIRDFTNAPQSGTFYPIALANKLAGTDLKPSQSDITASFSSAITDWYFGSGATPAGKYNFTSVVLHELGHGLGWVGSEGYAGGTGSWGYQGTQALTVYPAIYDRFVVSGSGQRMLDTTTFGNPSAALGNLYRSNNLYIDGAQAKAANGDTSPKLYAPTTWSEGSSVSHLDEAMYPKGNPNSLMTYAISSGESIYDPGPIVRGMFADMGWMLDDTTRQELLVSPAAIAFGSATVGTTSTTRTVTLLNNGTAPIALTAVNSTNAAEFPTTTNCPLPGTLQGGASCTHIIAFRPQALGTRSGELSISFGSPAATQTVTLSGTGVASTPSPSPSLAPSPVPSASPNPSVAPLTLAMINSVGGMIGATPALNGYPAGTPVTVQAIAQPGYRFIG
ncbi:MAG TPA: choice-of-anchor D domain-containing protein, partial [Thermomicrobiales bacterium]